jgi:hypothetical protein
MTRIATVKQTAGKPKSKPARKPLDLTPRRGHHDGQADQDWLEAEREVAAKGSR